MHAALHLDRTSLLAALGLAAGLMGAACQEAHAQSEVGRMFEERCISCHVPPDTRFEVDRAWLAQVADTA